ncbi:MAG: hypothetical protein V3V20_05435 [Algisphaera sp.]
MSPLTKAFVVLVTLLSVLLAALVIPFVAKTDNLTNEISTLTSQLSVAEASARSANAEKTLLVTQQSSGNAELDAAVATLRSENLRLSQQVASASANEQDAKNKVDKLGASMSLSNQSVTQLTSLLENRTTVLSSAQDEIVTVKTQNAQLVQQNNELDSQVNTLTATIRNMQERMVDASATASNASSSASSYTGHGATSIDTTNAVRGRVSGIDSSEGITLIQINIGSNDGVRTNSKLLIYRGSNNYIGSATISKVDGNVAIARVTQAKGSIQAGDSILAGVSF